MRTNNKIIKIIAIDFPSISFVSRNGEYRSINICTYFDKVNLSKADFGYEIIENQKLFQTVSLEDNALAWKNIIKLIMLPSGKKMEIFFHLDPLLTIKYSELIISKDSVKLGNKVKYLRNEQNITQEELAKRIGTTKHYISKVENSKTDIEFKTLQKIVEIGLNKKIFISIYDDINRLSSISNSVLKPEFIDWLICKKDDLSLIEGIGPKEYDFLKAENIKSTEDLLTIDFLRLIKILTKGETPLSFYKNVDSWLIQAKYIANAEWTPLIMLQKTVSGNNSKIEILAKKEFKEGIFNFE